jgi:hypothetical protein
MATGDSITWLLATETVKVTAGVGTTISGERRRLLEFVKGFKASDCSSVSRPTPWVVDISGASGIGKSRLADRLVKDLTNPAWCRVKGIDLKNLVYPWNPMLKHMDKYNQQSVVYIDDAYQTKGSTPSESEYTMRIPMVSATPWLVPMAKLEEKGELFTSRIIISTTNTPFPDPTEIISRQALWRRRNFLVEMVETPNTGLPALDPGRHRFHLLDPCPLNEQRVAVKQVIYLQKDLTYSDLLLKLVPDMNAFCAESDEYASSDLTVDQSLSQRLMALVGPVPTPSTTPTPTRADFGEEAEACAEFSALPASSQRTRCHFY